MMKEYGWRVPEAQRANLIMVEENMTALENGVQASTVEGGRGAEGGRVAAITHACRKALAFMNRPRSRLYEEHVVSADRRGGGGGRRRGCGRGLIVTPGRRKVAPLDWIRRTT